MMTFSKEPPVWVQFLTYHAVLKGITEATVIDKAMALKGLNRIRCKRVHVVDSDILDAMEAQQQRRRDEQSNTLGLSQKNCSLGADDSVTEFVDPSKDDSISVTISATRSTTPPPSGRREVPLPSDPVVRHRRWSTLRTVAQPLSDTGKKSSVKEHEAQNQRTWVLFAVAMDDILKYLLPTAFVIFLVIHVSILF
jgi:hypothetical protein